MNELAPSRGQPFVRQKWANWSGWVEGYPAQYRAPTSEAELSALVREAQQVRTVGAGHSFTALVPSEDLLLSLDHLSGLIHHDADNHTATVWAGTRLHRLGPMLQDIGQALPNMGDIDRQSVAGAISTGTHGSGKMLKALAGGVVSMRLVLANGETLECSASQSPEVFNAARVSLGTLGVISQITLQNIPSYRLQETIRVVDLQEALPQLASLAEQNRHLDCHVFPFGQKAMLKTLNPTPSSPTKDQFNNFVENTLLGWACDLTRVAPALNTPIQRLVSVLVGSSSRVEQSYKVFANPREVRFNEMEYHVPADKGPECLAEVSEAIRKSGIQVFFPLEYRYVAADSIWLSPFQGGPRASIAVHQYFKQDPWPLFRVVEPIFQRYGGRPHWGKMHSLKAEQLRELYPHWEDFARVRRELDPSGKFLNAYLRQLFDL